MKLSEMKINEIKRIEKINFHNRKEMLHLFSLGFLKNVQIKFITQAPFSGSRAFIVGEKIVSLPYKKCQKIDVY